VRAAHGNAIELWKGQVHEGDLAVPMTFGPGVTQHSYFRRRARRTQMLRLLHRLLRTPSRAILTTARTLDLALVALVAPERLPPRRVFMYFHWLRVTPFKRCLLRAVAARQPHRHDPLHDRAAGRGFSRGRISRRGNAAVSGARNVTR
jgi:hypothetical protein